MLPKKYYVECTNVKETNEVIKKFEADTIKFSYWKYVYVEEGEEINIFQI